jgi:hypothetical protein
MVAACVSLMIFLAYKHLILHPADRIEKGEERVAILRKWGMPLRQVTVKKSRYGAPEVSIGGYATIQGHLSNAMPEDETWFYEYKDSFDRRFYVTIYADRVTASERGSCLK